MGSVVLALAALSLLLLPVTVSASSTVQPLSLTAQGIITSAGDQTYSLSGGQFVGGSFFFVPLPSTDSVTYNLQATVNGLQVSGQGSLSLSSAGQGGFLSLQASFQITGMVAAAVFPLTETTTGKYVSCTTDCTSEIPLLFTGVATVGSIQPGQSDPPIKQGIQIPIAIESAYWNPFGGPILISLGSLQSPWISIIATYTTATISWSNVELDGVLSGKVGGTLVSGDYVQQSFSQENLVAGKESDSGAIAFVYMSPSFMDASGTYSGTTTIPPLGTAGSYDCSAQLGLPEGTCTATGATSVGSFSLSGDRGVQVTGTYDTTWSVPSLTTTSTITGTVTGIVTGIFTHGY